MNRRAHRLAQVKAWADARPRYKLCIGHRVIGFDCLTDEAFDDLRDEIACDWWSERRRALENRALMVRQAYGRAA